MGMRYWTAMSVGTSRSRLYSDRHPMQLSGALDTKEGISQELMRTRSFGTLLIEPTPEDILALRNAVVYETTSATVHVALSPLTLVSTMEARVNRCRYPNWRLEDWAKKFGDKVIVVKEGKIVRMCEGCPKILHRASGACSMFYTGCTYSSFGTDVSKLPEMIMPSEDLFIPLSRCSNRKPFNSYTLDSIDVTVTPETQYEPDEKLRDVAFSGATTKYAKKLICPACIFSTEKNRCAGYRHAQRCEGPHLAANLPQPDERTRRLLRVLGTQINWQKYMKAAEQHKEWKVRKWRLDPCLEIGVLPGNPLTLGIVQTRGSQNNYEFVCTPREDEQVVLDLFVGAAWDVELNSKPTTLERLLCVAVESKCLCSTHRCGWGSCWNQFYSARYWQDRDTAALRYLLRTNTLEEQIGSVTDLIDGHPSVISHAYKYVNRSREHNLINLIHNRDLGGTNLKVVKAVADRLAQADRAVEESGGELPTVKQLIEEETAKVG